MRKEITVPVEMGFCSKGQHKLIPIYSHSVDYGAERVVRWCEICGAVVVDTDVDGRTNPGNYRKLQAPKVAGYVARG